MTNPTGGTTHPVGGGGTHPVGGSGTGPGRAVAAFSFPATGQEIRTVVRDGEPWFVAADVCSVLGYNNGRMAVGRLPERMKGVTEVDTLGGRQSVALISEPGAYRLIMRSNLPAAEAFQDWIAEEVVPAIRRTGRYEVAAVSRKELARMILESEEARELAEARVLELEPSARAWDTLASADGDFSVADAAKVLSRDPAIKLGRDRLFTLLRDYGWIYRQRSDGRWRVKQTAVETGRLSELPSSHYHPRTGELVLDPPLVRVTAKGVRELHKRLGGTSPLTDLATSEANAA